MNIRNYTKFYCILIMLLFSACGPPSYAKSSEPLVITVVVTNTRNPDNYSVTIPINSIAPIPPTLTFTPSNTPKPIVYTPNPLKPNASLYENILVSPCNWNVSVLLTGFEPNSKITVNSIYNEVECSSGNKINSSWSVIYTSQTNSSGSLVTTYHHQGTGNYTYSFLDSEGNTATVSFTTNP